MAALVASLRSLARPGCPRRGLSLQPGAVVAVPDGVHLRVGDGLDGRRQPGGTATAGSRFPDTVAALGPLPGKQPPGRMGPLPARAACGPRLGPSRNAIYASRTMTVKERLHAIVDELSDPEADDALRLIEARRAGDWWAQKPVAIELDAEAAVRFDDAVSHPERSEAGLRRLATRAADDRQD